MPVMEKKIPNIRVLAENQADLALQILAATGRAYDGVDVEKLMAGITSGTWRFVVASVEGRDIGCFYLNLNPKYRVYQALKLPELQDLRVSPDFRQQGIGQALVEYGEGLAQELKAPGLGVSVGLSPDYGAAQRLYARMGFLPDGNGVTQNREPVAKGARIVIDEDACLMLMKLWG